MRLFQRKKIVLCINTQQTLAGIWHGKKLQQQVTFAQNETGLQAFGKFLRQHSLARFYLIFDVADEGYQYQLLPHSTGRTQKTLISRKLAQIYRDFTYKTAIYYGREQTPPKKDIYLFAAVRAEQALHPWLALLQTAACKLVGAYLLSSLSERLLRSSLITQHLQNTKNLLLCERLSSGLRHTYFAHGRFIMSRLLTNLPDTENARLDFYQAEIEKSRLYLISQRLITADTPFSVLSLNLHQQAHIDLSNLAHRLRLPLSALQNTPELMYMQLLINGAKPANLAPQALTQHYQQQRTTHQFAALSFIVAITCAGLSAYHFKQGLQLSAESQRLRTQVAQAQQNFSKLKPQSHALSAEAQTLKNTVEAAKRIAGFPTTPQHMMQVLSKGFSQMKDADMTIKLRSLDWSLHTNQTATASHESALLSLEINAMHEARTDPTLQSYVSHLRGHPDVMSVEILPAAETNKPQAWQGNTVQDGSIVNDLQIIKLNVTLNSIKITEYRHEAP